MFSQILESYLATLNLQKSEVINQADLVLMCQVEGVKTVKVRALTQLKCFLCQMFMLLAKCAMEKDITEKL